MNLTMACRILAEKNMVVANSGNASLRYEDNMIISGTGVWFKDIVDGDFATVNIIDCSLNKNCIDMTPSKEVLVHSQIYQKRSDVNCIIHFQSPYATTLCALEDFRMVRLGNIPEMIYYIKKYAMSPYSEPGSAQLANDVSEAFAEDDTVSVVGIRSHGLFAVGPDIDSVVKKIFFFELDCQVSMQKYLIENGLDFSQR